VNPRHDGGGHRRIADKCAANLPRAPGTAFERQRRVEARRAGLDRFHVHGQALLRRREGERIFQVDRHERRDVEGFRRGGAERA
jgi:hypothetical protein